MSHITVDDISWPGNVMEEDTEASYEQNKSFTPRQNSRPIMQKANSPQEQCVERR